LLNSEAGKLSGFYHQAKAALSNDQKLGIETAELL
jgi:hypothetical protein